MNLPLRAVLVTFGWLFAMPVHAQDFGLKWSKFHGDLSQGLDNGFEPRLARDASGNLFVVEYAVDGNEDWIIRKLAPNGTLLWEKRYGSLGDGPEEYPSVAVDSQGNMILAGPSNGDMCTLKFSSADGSVLWETRYHGPGTGSFAYGMKVDAQDNVVVTGGSHGGVNSDAYTAKYLGADGSLIWEKRYNGPANGADRATGVALDSSGNVIITGMSTGTSEDFYTAKYAAANGSLLWERRYNDPDNQAGYANVVAVDGAGNAVVAGKNGSAAYIAKYAAANGELLWEQTEAALWPEAVVIDAAGNVFVGGSAQTGRNDDALVLSYAAEGGALRWSQRHNGPGDQGDWVMGMAIDPAGAVLFTGRSTNAEGEGVVCTFKCAASDGSVIWNQRRDGVADEDERDSGWSVLLEPSGDVVVAGVSSNFPLGYDCYVAKYAGANGAMAWEQLFDVSHSIEAGAAAVAVDGDGNVVSAGFSGSGSYTAKYAAANGSLLWEARRPGPEGGNAKAVDVAIAPGGDVIVAGETRNVGNPDFHIGKYAAANGALLWQRTYNGPGGEEDVPAAVVVDAAGNVIVTGKSRGTSSLDYYTAKYAAADGAVIWEKRYNGPANGDDNAAALAVDAAGNVIVTGFSAHASATCYTVKYAAADGGILWESRENGTGKKVAVDASGNVVVAGRTGGTSDYLVRRHAGASGNELWHKTYNGPANSWDTLNDMGLDPAGNVIVTGQSAGVTATLKYAAADGAVVWEKRLADGGDYASFETLEVDSAGYAFCAGYRYPVSGDQGNNVWIVRLAPADGAVAWEATFDRTRRDDEAFAMALDAGDNPVIAGYSDGDTYDGAFATFSYARLAANLELQQPPGASLMDGAARDFGMTSVGSEAVRTFRLANTGMLPLTGVGVSLGGDDPGLFSFSGAPAGTLAAGGEVVFQIRFAPDSPGSKSAAFLLSSDDPDVPLFDVALSGSGAEPEAVFSAISDAAGLSGEAAEPEATPFDDGVSNLLKYAFNMNLAGPDSATMVPGSGSSGLPSFTLADDEEGPVMKVEFLRRKGSGLVYTPKRSTSLSPESFEPMTGSLVITPVGDLWERVTLEEVPGPDPDPRAFSVIEVTFP